MLRKKLRTPPWNYTQHQHASTPLPQVSTASMAVVVETARRTPPVLPLSEASVWQLVDLQAEPQLLGRHGGHRRPAGRQAAQDPMPAEAEAVAGGHRGRKKRGPER